ncbi:MAG TPA: hypothetical protein VG013_10450, partial [Gemmataceae bacterium]|nr:hypothetical protein [Gemmataceae bacterium]
MTNDQDRGQLTEDRKGAVVHCCDLCARAEGWDFSRPLEELEKGMGVRAVTIFADQADEWAARG